MKSARRKSWSASFLRRETGLCGSAKETKGGHGAFEGEDAKDASTMFKGKDEEWRVILQRLLRSWGQGKKSQKRFLLEGHRGGESGRAIGPVNPWGTKKTQIVQDWRKGEKEIGGAIGKRKRLMMREIKTRRLRKGTRITIRSLWSDKREAKWK